MINGDTMKLLKYILLFLTPIAFGDMILNDVFLMGGANSNATANATNALNYITLNGTNYGEGSSVTFDGSGVSAVGSTFTFDGGGGGGGDLSGLSNNLASVSNDLDTVEANMATGTPLYVETDPIWTNALANGFTVKGVLQVEQNVYLSTDLIVDGNVSVDDGISLNGNTISNGSFAGDGSGLTNLSGITETDPIWTNAQASGFTMGDDINLGGNSLSAATLIEAPDAVNLTIKAGSGAIDPGGVLYLMAQEAHSSNYNIVIDTDGYVGRGLLIDGNATLTNGSFIGNGAGLTNILSTGTSTWYVSKAGSDNNSGLSEFEPKLTITNAVAGLQALGIPGVVVIETGQYNEDVIITNRVSLLGSASRRTIINGSLSITGEVKGASIQSIGVFSVGNDIRRLVTVNTTGQTHEILFDDCTFATIDYTPAVQMTYVSDPIHIQAGRVQMRDSQIIMPSANLSALTNVITYMMITNSGTTDTIDPFVRLNRMRVSVSGLIMTNADLNIISTHSTNRNNFDGLTMDIDTAGTVNNHIRGIVFHRNAVENMVENSEFHIIGDDDTVGEAEGVVGHGISATNITYVRAEKDITIITGFDNCYSYEAYNYVHMNVNNASDVTDDGYKVGETNSVIKYTGSPQDTLWQFDAVRWGQYGQVYTKMPDPSGASGNSGTGYVAFGQTSEIVVGEDHTYNNIVIATDGMSIAAQDNNGDYLNYNIVISGWNQVENNGENAAGTLFPEEAVRGNIETVNGFTGRVDFVGITIGETYILEVLGSSAHGGKDCDGMSYWVGGGAIQTITNVIDNTSVLATITNVATNTTMSLYCLEANGDDAYLNALRITGPSSPGFVKTSGDSVMQGNFQMGGYDITNAFYYGDGSGLTNLPSGGGSASPVITVNNSLVTTNQTALHADSVVLTTVDDAALLALTNCVVIGTGITIDQAAIASGAVIIGRDAQTGTGSATLYNSSVTIGQGADTGSSGETMAVAIGRNTDAATRSISIGTTANSEEYGVAIGGNAASADDGIAIGYDSGNSTYGVGINIGRDTGGTYGRGIGLGHKSNANQTNGIAIGNSAYARDFKQTAIGPSVRIDNTTDGMAIIGDSVTVTSNAPNQFATGWSNKVATIQGLSLNGNFGYTGVLATNGTYTMRHDGDGDGAWTTLTGQTIIDAPSDPGGGSSGGSASPVTTVGNSLVTTNQTALHTDSVILTPVDDSALDALTNAVVIGSDITVIQANTASGPVAIGNGASSGGVTGGWNYGVALGYGANTVFAGESYSVSIGYNADSEYNGVAIGQNSDAASYGVALGRKAYAISYGIAIGNEAGSASTGSGISIGHQSAFHYSRGTSIGHQSKAAQTNGIAIGNYSRAWDYKQVAIGTSVRIDSTTDGMAIIGDTVTIASNAPNQFATGWSNKVATIQGLSLNGNFGYIGLLASNGTYTILQDGDGDGTLTITTGHTIIDAP